MAEDNAEWFEAIDKAAYALERAKLAEDEAKEKRIEAEGSLTAAVSGIGHTHDVTEGSVTQKAQYYKVVIRTVINRRIDAKLFEKNRREIPAALTPFVMKPSLDKKKFDALLKSDNKKVQKAVLDCITETPGKTGVTIERIEEKK